MSKWDSNAPKEIKTTTNWSEELLEKAQSEEDIERTDVIPGKDVFLLRPCFNQQECDNIITAAELLGFGRTDYPKKYRGNLRLITEDDSLSLELWRRVCPHVPSQVTEDGHVWDAVGLNECFRLSKYSDGDVFGSHVDTCYIRNSIEKSMYTVNIYLNSAGPGKQLLFMSHLMKELTVYPTCEM